MRTETNSKSGSEGRERPDYNGAVTALTADEWKALADNDSGLYLVVQRDPEGEMTSRPWDRASALRVFAGVLNQIGDDFAPAAPFSMQVMSVSEWARVGAR